MRQFPQGLQIPGKEDCAPPKNAGKAAILEVKMKISRCFPIDGDEFSHPLMCQTQMKNVSFHFPAPRKAPLQWDRVWVKSKKFLKYIQTRVIYLFIFKRPGSSPLGGEKLQKRFEQIIIKTSFMNLFRRSTKGIPERVITCYCIRNPMLSRFKGQTYRYPPGSGQLSRFLTNQLYPWGSV